MMRWSDQLPRMMSPGLLLILASCDCKYRRRARTDWLPFARAEASQRPWLRGSPVGSCPARKTSSCSTGVCGRSPSEMDTNASKGLGPSTCAVEDAQDLDRVAKQPVWHDERRSRDHEFACSRNSRQQAFNIVEDVERNTLRGCRIVLLDIGPQCDEVGNGFRRPDWCRERLGTGFSFALPHEATQSLTRFCGTPSPWPSEAIARLMPATCHSLTSRYSLIASAARKERLRPVLLANRSSRFFTPVSTLTVNVVERMTDVCLIVIDCVQNSAKPQDGQSRFYRLDGCPRPSGRGFAQCGKWLR